MERQADVLVIGAGVFGLWTALECTRAGLRVICVDQDQACKDGGAGASWGIVGALSPFPPTRWRALKRFQFDALTSLEEATVGLTEATGLPTGYRRSGRLTPLANRGERDRAVTQMAAARTHWQVGSNASGVDPGLYTGKGARFEVLDSLPLDSAPDLARFLPEENRPCGLISDTLSAQIVPRLYMRALARAVAQAADLRAGWEARAVDGTAGRAVFSVAPSGASSGSGSARNETLSEETVSAGAIVIAAGWQSPTLADTRPGEPIRGQAALLQAETPENMPVIRLPGLYIVAQPAGMVAVGSTKEPGRNFVDLGAGRDDDGNSELDELIARARRLCPPLAEAPVIERWSGIRPKPPGRDPTVGQVPGCPRLYLASGGYGIGLGLGHLAGKALAGLIAGTDGAVPIPEEFAPEAKGEVS